MRDWYVHSGEKVRVLATADPNVIVLEITDGDDPDDRDVYDIGLTNDQALSLATMLITQVQTGVFK